MLSAGCTSRRNPPVLHHSPLSRAVATDPNGIIVVFARRALGHPPLEGACLLSEIAER